MRNDDTVGRPFTDHERGERSPLSPSGEDHAYPSSPRRSEAPVVYEGTGEIPLTSGRAWRPLSLVIAVVLVVLGVIVPNPFAALVRDDAAGAGMVPESIARHRMFLPAERPGSAALAIPEQARAAAPRKARVPTTTPTQ